MTVFYPLYLFCGVLVAITTILSITTVSIIKKKKLVNKRHRISCKCKACIEKTNNLTKFGSLKFLEPLTLAFVIFTVIIVISTFVGLTSITDTYNPYKILNVEDRTHINIISTAHSRLVRVAKKNETLIKELDDAHSYISNSTIRENYEKYGNHNGLKLVGLGNTFIPPEFFDMIESHIEFINFSILVIVIFYCAILFIVKRLKKILNRDDLSITIKVYKKLLKESPTAEDVIESLSASSKIIIVSFLLYLFQHNQFLKLFLNIC